MATGGQSKCKFEKFKSFGLCSSEKKLNVTRILVEHKKNLEVKRSLNKILIVDSEF